jgi:flagellar biosynthesis/type III secretory pathway protein FliH
MTTLHRARILKSATPVTPSQDRLPSLTPAQHHRVTRELVVARETAARLVAEARAEASALLADARAAAEGVGHAAAVEAREAEEAKLAAHYLRLRQEEERRAEIDLDRAIALAVVLSERLLGEALEHDPKHVVSLARQALSEARGARRVVIDASPLDADVLQRHLVDVGFGSQAVEVRADPALSRGALRLTTSLGNLDAQLRPQLERLARALRDTLQRA